MSAWIYASGTLEIRKGEKKKALETARHALLSELLPDFVYPTHGGQTLTGLFAILGIRWDSRALSIEDTKVSARWAWTITDVLFKSLGPFVKRGGEVVFVYDGERQIYTFTGRECKCRIPEHE